MKFRTDEIASVLREEIAQYRRETGAPRAGRVLEVGDGIAQIYGLGDAMAGEMLQFDSGALGQVFNLEQNSVGAVIYAGGDAVCSGETVHATGKLLEVPVGRHLLGRVIDPLGRPLDGGPAVADDVRRPVEVAAPGIAERQPVTEPLQTGLKAVDAMTPIGRGQRELIIGDRKTGKTAIALDAILSQRDTGVLCVYVAIGQKESTVASVVEALRRYDALAHTVIVSASSSDAAALQFVAPYAGCAIAEHFMLTEGADTLVVYDDLSKQAASYRQISLLLRRPPGREAYPGDVFYIHSRLLERACRLADRHVIVPEHTPADARGVVGVDGEVYVGPLGLRQARRQLEILSSMQSLRIHRLPESGGSMTALPVCETQEGEVSAYIPTNLIGITDGQIYLEPGLFFAGIRPAVNVGISVSRVGYKAAVPAMKRVAASLRLDLAAYRELEAFAQLGMDLDAHSQRQLSRGERMVRLLTQAQYRPMPIVEQVISIFAGAQGYLDDLDVDEVPAFEQAMLEFIRRERGGFLAELAADPALDAGQWERLQTIIQEFRKSTWSKIRSRSPRGAAKERRGDSPPPGGAGQKDRP